MEVYFQLVNDAESLRKACEELRNEPFLGFDVETTELDPYKGELRLVQLSNGAKTIVVDIRAFGSGAANHPVAEAVTPLLRKEGSLEGATTPSAPTNGVGTATPPKQGGEFLRTNPDLAPLRDLLSSTKQTKIAHN